jgi:hypothetical protein
MRRMCTSIGISISGTRPLRKAWSYGAHVPKSTRRISWLIFFERCGGAIEPSLARQVLLTCALTGNDPAGRGLLASKLNGPRGEPARTSATNVGHGLTALIVRRIS